MQLIYGISKIVLISLVINFFTGVSFVGSFLILTAVENGMRSIMRTRKLMERCEALEARVKELEQTTW